MIGYWFYKFEVEDRDIGVVDYVAIEEAVDIKPPVASLCFIDPFIRSKLAKTFPGIDSSSYLDFLKGEHFDENLNDVDYSNVSLNLDEFLFFCCPECDTKSPTRAMFVNHALIAHPKVIFQ